MIKWGGEGGYFCGVEKDWSNIFLSQNFVTRVLPVESMKYKEAQLNYVNLM